jgi:3-oxoacyl-[acyl-carrier-protein] synthase II
MGEIMWRVPEEGERFRPGREIVITGFGAVTPLGKTAEETWEAMLAGKSGVRPHETGHPKIGVAALVEKGFESTDYLPKKKVRDSHRSVHLAAAAVEDALETAGLLDNCKNIILTQEELERIGVNMASCIGGAAEESISAQRIVNEKGADRISPKSPLRMLTDRHVDVASMHWGIKGPVYSPNSACASSLTAVSLASKEIVTGAADIMITGGVESINLPIMYGAFSMALASDISSPFDEDREGFVVGEAAVAFVVERRSHAESRGATPFVEIAGYAETADADHPTLLSGEGSQRAMRLALEMADLAPGEIDAIFPHATGTQLGDPKERDAIINVFGDALENIVVVPTKGNFGHTFAAAGGIGMLAAILCMRDGVVSPAVNLINPIDRVITDELEYDSSMPSLYVPTEIVEKPIKTAMINAFGFGGKNAVVILRKAE